MNDREHDLPGEEAEFDRMLEEGTAVEKFSEAPLGVQFRMINEGFKKAMDKSIDDLGLSMSQMGVLFCLDHMRDRKVSQKMLCDAFHVKHPTMVGILRRMEERELIEQKVDEDNRRARVVRLTPKSESFLREHKERMDIRDRHFLDGFTEDEKNEFEHLLTKFYVNLLNAALENDTN